MKKTISALVAAGASVLLSSSAFAASSGGGQWNGCDANYWASNNTNTAAIAGGSNYLTGCSSIAVARVYRTSGGSVYRNQYVSDTTPTNGGFAAYATPTPAGTTYLRTQYRVCGRDQLCTEFSQA